MNIGLLTNTYPPNSNGVSVSVSSLEKELIKQGHQVFVATPEVKNFDYPSNVLPIKNSTKVPSNISPDLQVAYFFVDQVTQFFAQNKVEIVHSHDTAFGGMEAVLVADRLNVPSVHTYHTCIEDYSYFDFPGYTNLVRQYCQIVCNQYDHIICPSEKIYNYLLKLGVKVPLSHIFNVIDLSDLNEKNDKKELQDKIGNQIQPDDFVFITFCRLAKEKGLDRSIKVLAPLLKKYSNIKYLICGDGAYKDQLQKQVSDLGLSNQVIFAGKYTRSELPFYAKFAKAFLFTSTTENLPTNLLEAMHLGLPVVAIDDDSIDYLLKNNENGFKAKENELTDLCEKLYHDPKLLAKFSNQAKKSAKKLEPRKLAAEHLNLYKIVAERFKEKSRPKKPFDLKKLATNLKTLPANIKEILLQILYR